MSVSFPHMTEASIRSDQIQVHALGKEIILHGNYFRACRREIVTQVLHMLYSKRKSIYVMLVLCNYMED